MSNNKSSGDCIDYTFETTENKSLKEAGGIIGFGLTLRGNSLLRWLLSRRITAQYAMKMNTSTSDTHQNEPGWYCYGKASNKRWNDDVQKITKMWIDLTPMNILCIWSHCKYVNQNSLTFALDEGSRMLKQCLWERLIGNEHSERKSLHDPLTISNVKTKSLINKQ